MLHTPGGLVLAATQIATALADHDGPVHAIVSHYAMSGGTLVALAADEIQVDPHAALGPVDPQVGEYPAASIAAAIQETKDPDDKTLILADMSRKALRQVRGLCRAPSGAPHRARAGKGGGLRPRLRGVDARLPPWTRRASEARAAG